MTGNLQGLQASQRRALERTFRRRVAPERVVTGELARHLSGLSRELGRQVGVLVSRDGTVRHVIVGDASRLMLPDIGRLRGGAGRFRGLRLVHTHLRGEPLTADDLNDLALLRLDMVAMVQAREDGLPGPVEVAYLDPAGLAVEADGEPERDPFVHVQARNPQELDLDFLATIQALEDELARVAEQTRGPRGSERALVIGVRPDDEHFAETLELVRSANVSIAGTIRQTRQRVHPKTVIGSGKLQEVVLEAMRRNAEVAIFDINLKPAQARAFEDATGLKAIDRTQLILDIFAQRARSRDGKLQVELAQLRYSLPRLTEQDAGLSRLTGGIGGRGPGETVMEIGRRRIRDRIRALEKQVERLSKQRDVQRRRRRRSGLPVLAIVGYTNAGKSTLLNALTESDIDVEDRLFMTLDPTSRRLRFPQEGEVIISDTVGFISELPADLVAAFRATLEELEDADLLLHVADASDPRIEDKIAAVDSLLAELDLTGIPTLVVLNKADQTDPELGARLARRHDGVLVSALRRSGLGRLIESAEARLAASTSRTRGEAYRPARALVLALAGAALALAVPRVAAAQDCGTWREPVLCHAELSLRGESGRWERFDPDDPLALAPSATVEIELQGRDQIGRTFPSNRLALDFDDRDCAGRVTIEDLEEGRFRVRAGGSEGRCRLELWVPGNLNFAWRIDIEVARALRTVYTRAEAEIVAAALYRAILGRDADPSGLAGAVAEIQRGNLEAQVRAMLRSSEFLQRETQLDTTELLEQFYQGLLSRAPDANGIDAFRDDMLRRRWTEVILAIVRSEEFEQKF